MRGRPCNCAGSFPVVAGQWPDATDLTPARTQPPRSEKSARLYARDRKLETQESEFPEVRLHEPIRLAERAFGSSRSDVVWCHQSVHRDQNIRMSAPSPTHHPAAPGGARISEGTCFRRSIARREPRHPNARARKPTLNVHLWLVRSPTLSQGSNCGSKGRRPARGRGR